MKRPYADEVFTQWFSGTASGTASGALSGTTSGALSGTASGALSPTQCLFVVGGHCIGKTHWIQEMAEQKGLRILWITPDKCDSSEVFQSQFKRFLFSTIDTAFDDFPLTHYLIVIDDWDTMISHDRTMFITFQTLLAKSLGNPHNRRMVCLGHCTMEKRFREVKGATFLSLYPFNETDVCLYLRERFPALSTGFIATLTERCEGNLRYALETATFESQSLSVLPPKTQSQEHPSPKKTRKKTSISPSIPASSPISLNYMYDTVDKKPTLQCLFELSCPQEGAQLVQQDPWMIPLRYHENLWKELENHKGNQSQKIQLYNRCLDTLLSWDAFMSHTLTSDTGFPMDSIADIAGWLFYATQQFLPRLKTPKHTNADLNAFTKILSQMSLHKKYMQGFYERYKGTHYPIYDYPSHWFAE